MNIKTISFGTKDLVTPDSVVEPHLVGALIGKGAQGVKRCISDSWRMYDKLQSSDKKIEENKPSLRIVFRGDREEDINENYPDQVWIEISSASENMMKLSELSVRKHIKKFIASNTLSPQAFIIEFPERLLGKLIGKQASGLNRILSNAIKNRGDIHTDDVETAKTARLQVSNLGVDKDEKGNSSHIINYVNARQNRSFLGWPPSEDDEYEQYIDITVSFKRDVEPFKDRQLYIERLSGVIVDRVQQILNQDEEQMDEINECLGFDDQ